MIDLALIVAKAENNVIGRNNKLPWYLPQDLKYFKQVTMGKPIIMGRKTFESIGKPLAGRKNIVISRQTRLHLPAEVALVSSIQEALQVAHADEVNSQQNEAMLIGGAEIYRLALEQNLVKRLYLTQVHAQVEGDAYFPELDMQQWQEVSRQDFKAADSNPYAYSFIVLEKHAVPF